MSSTLSNILSAISSLSTPLASVFGGSNAATTQIQQYIASLEAANDNPAAVASLARDIYQVNGCPAQVAILAQKLELIAGEPAGSTGFNPATVIMYANMIATDLTTTSSNILTHLLHVQASTPATTTAA